MSDLPEGSLVVLKSGGPLMTTEKSVNSLVGVVWFVSDTSFRDTFHRDALVVVWRSTASDIELFKAVQKEKAEALDDIERKAQAMREDKSDLYPSQDTQ